MAAAANEFAAILQLRIPECAKVLVAECFDHERFDKSSLSPLDLSDISGEAWESAEHLVRLVHFLEIS